MSTAKVEKTAFFFPCKGVLKPYRTIWKVTVSFSCITRIPLFEFSWSANEFLHNIKVKSEQLQWELSDSEERTQKKKKLAVSAQG